MKKYIHFLSWAVLAFITFSIFNSSRNTEESFTYFPKDQNATFHVVDTSLTLLDRKKQRYTMQWRIHSLLDRKAYLRQDIGLLFVNGILKEKIGEGWKQNTDIINLNQKIKHKESANFRAVSYHHAEIHSDEEITSLQEQSYDEIYVLDSKFSPLHSFRQPNSKEEKEWKSVIDSIVTKRLESALEVAQRSYQFQPENYIIFPLTNIIHFEESPISGFTLQETNEIIGRLWEGLYKNYFLGIKKKDGTIVDPIGSTIPLILIAKDKSHLLVISQLKTGESMLLRQQLPSH